MGPLNDAELDDLLRQYQAQPAPESLARKVRQARRGRWWKWLWTGSIRIPVPVAILLATLVVLMLSMKRDAAKPAEQAGFQPVKRLEPRIIRSNYENYR